METKQTHRALDLAMSKIHLSNRYFYVVEPGPRDKNWTPVTLVVCNATWEHWVNDYVIVSTKTLTRMPEL